tara:strand:+ start:1809 stop:2057 length:249 start_codon:yes stop_codon:yes gene_type:complete
MKEFKKNNFTTMDVYISAFISLFGIQPALKLNNGKVIFSFNANDDLCKIMMNYNSNVSVPVADFTSAIKSLRGKMLSMKDSQ